MRVELKATTSSQAPRQGAAAAADARLERRQAEKVERPHGAKTLGPSGYDASEAARRTASSNAPHHTPSSKGGGDGGGEDAP